MNIYLKEAVEKLDKECQEAKVYMGAAVVIKDVCNALKLFCEQDSEFAQAVAQTDGTLADCCEHIVEGEKEGISDLQAYQKAVQFYFPGATVKFEMHIQVNPYEIEQTGSLIDITSLL